MKICLNEPEYKCLELFRMALSEKKGNDRLCAIEVMRREVVSLGLQNFPVGKSSHPDFVEWVGRTAEGRYEAAHRFSEIAQRYEGRNQRKLNIAEDIGKRVWDSIQARRFLGVYVKGGLLDQVSDYAKQHSISGARDRAVLEKIWTTYRGVVHLGMAMDYCEMHPKTQWHVLHLAEKFRVALSSNCPRKHPNPYVDPQDQISFLYISGA
jgi:hypothetical protein